MWTAEKTEITVVEELSRKARLVNLSGAYKLVFISKSGFTEKAIKRMKELNALYLGLDDIKMLFDKAD